MAVVHVFDFLESADHTPAPVYVIFGEDLFLASLATKRVRAIALGEDAEDIPDSRLDGTDAEWRDLYDELTTVSLFGDTRRFVQLIDAERFISANRARLEEYLERPSSTGVLLICTSSWPSNTRLFKLVQQKGTAIHCSAPTKSSRSKQPDWHRIRDWIMSRCANNHQAQLTQDAADELVQIIGLDFGRMDQEMQKCSIYVGKNGTISRETVTDVVGGWRTKTTWDFLDAVTEGNSDEAVRQLDRLLHAGESVQAIFGALSWSLRRFADATRIVQRMERQGQRVNLPAALVEAGFHKWPRGAIDSAERQLRQIGRQRAGQLYRWLLDVDLALKGSHATPERARFKLEQLVVRLSRTSASLRQQG